MIENRGAIRAAATLAVFVCMLLMLPPGRSFAATDSVPQSIDVLALTRSQAAGGAAVEVDGVPMFVQLPAEHKDADIFFAPMPGTSRTLQVTLIPEPAEARPQVLVLPVSIEDKTLARGVELNLITPMGNKATIKIPPKRVFISMPFTVPVTEQAHKDFGMPGYDHLMLQVVPKITKKAQITMDNTSQDGLVADIKYEGIAYFRLKDLLNRTNRRDMDGTFFVGKNQDKRWHIITENVFQKYDKRNLGVMRDQRLTSTTTTHLRVDNLGNFNSLKFGDDTTFATGSFRFRMGNIDRHVKPRYHAEAGVVSNRLSAIVRAEGLEIKNPPTHSPVDMRVDQLGWQVGANFEHQNSSLDFILGTLKVQDLENQGEIDDHFNFLMKYTAPFGRTNNAFSQKRFNLAGTVDLDYYGVGSATWMLGEINTNVTVLRDYLIYVRLNNDFARVTGIPPKPLWESMFFSFMRNRNYFEANDPLARFGLDSVFVDVRYQRQRKGDIFEKDIKIGVSKFLKLFKYDLPIDIFIETNRVGKYRPGAAISIRQYL